MVRRLKWHPSLPGRRLKWHPSLRLKLTAAFAGAMAVLLAGLGLFIYDSFQAGLDRSLNQSLRSRAADVRVLNAQADTGLADSRTVLTDTHQSAFAQVLRGDGRIVDATPGMAKLRLLSFAERRRGWRGALLIDRSNFPGGPVRLFVSPASSQDGRPLLIVVGASLRDRQAALEELSALLLLGGPVALLLASLLGHAVAALSLRSVEALRRRAGELSVIQPGERLPVPEANDELGRLAVTLNQMLERNEAAFARERRFVADASHELRTPLSVLKGELEVALTGESSVHELRAALVSAGSEADRVIGLAQDLLALEQADNGTLPVKLQEVSVADAFGQITRRYAAARAQRRIVMGDDTDGLRIRADIVQLQMALSNLVENALRHATGDVTLSAVCRSDVVELHVEDEGPGFPEGFLAVAFERFTRADGGRSTEGTGLGLAIVRSIVRAHGGEVRAANRSSGGTDVWLELPNIRTRPSMRKPAALTGDPRAHLGCWRP